MENKCIFAEGGGGNLNIGFYGPGFSTICIRNDKKESIFPYKKGLFHFMWDISARDSSAHLQKK